MSRLFAACAMIALASCANPQDLNGDGIIDSSESGRDPNSISLIAPSNPVGSVAGLVVNPDQTPLSGATITLLYGSTTEAGKSITTESNENGYFTFAAVPAVSNVQLIVSKNNYTSARVSVSVPGSAGNVPVNDANGNAGVITIFPLTGSLKFQVYTYAGKAARGAKAFLDSTPLSGNVIFTSSAEVSDDGSVSFSAVPVPSDVARLGNGSYVLTVLPYDENDDGRPEALGSVTSYTARSLVTANIDPVVLADPRVGAALNIVATNIDSLRSTAASVPLRNAVAENEAITVLFNQPITQVDATRSVKVVQEDCQTNVPVTVTQVSPTAIRIASTTKWSLGSRYNIVIRATGLDSGSTVDFTGYFFALDSSTPRAVSTTLGVQVKKAVGNMNNAALQPGDQLFVVFDTPITMQTGATAARVFINADLNGDGSIGGMTCTGETGCPTGFPLVAAEITSAAMASDGTFTCRTSNYSSRWSVTYVFPAPATVNTVSFGTNVLVKFPKDSSSTDTYQTAWGVPISGDVSGNLQ